jgi:hypothetical protein
LIDDHCSTSSRTRSLLDHRLFLVLCTAFPIPPCIIVKRDALPTSCHTTHISTSTSLCIPQFQLVIEAVRSAKDGNLIANIMNLIANMMNNALMCAAERFKLE